MVTNLDSLTVLDEALPNGGAPAVDAVEEAGFGCLETVRGGLPLRRLGVNGRITGLLYRVVVAQEFVNACAEPLEATYIFPLPARAGVTRFRLRVGERVIEGVLKERGAARAEYDQAIRAGYRAAIAEEERPEVFTVRAGNIPPGEAVGVELELAGPLAFADGEATFRFPLVVAPRYIPGIALDGPGVGQGTAWDTDAVPDASRISPPVLLPGQPNPVYLTFRMELDPAGLPLADLRASLHALRLNRAEGDIRVVELTPGAERLDRDFILRFRVGEASVCGGFSVYRDPDGETTTLLTVVPPAPLPTSLRPRDVVMLLDRSGSMEGWKMAAARRAAGRLLDALTEQDRFGVLLFDDRIEEPAPSAGRLVAATDRNRFRAVEFLARVEARGGTEIAPALNRALQYFLDPPDAGRERILLFVTDGQVGNEDQLLHQIQQQARHCRIFAVGIDQAVNASLLERLASYGGGHCELVESEDRLDDVLRAVHRRLGAPLLTDIRLEPALEDVAPDTVDLFPGVPVRLGGRLRGPLPAQVAVTARTADGQPFRQVLTPMETPDSAVRTLWARARVLDLEHRFAAHPRREPQLVDDITAFSLRYGVLCRFTAFVAVDRSETVNPGGEVLQVTQAVEPPAEWAMPMAACAPPPAPMAVGGTITGSMAALRLAEPPPGQFEMPDFTRQPLPTAPPSPTPGSRSGSGFGGIGPHLKRSISRLPTPPKSPRQPTPPKSLPDWFANLETLLNAPVPDQSEQLDILRDAVMELDALGATATDLVKEGRELIHRLESGRVEFAAMRKRLQVWSKRIRKLLESQWGDKRRWFWWK